MWTMLVFFAWVIWFWLLITVFSDVFRRHDISGWAKTGWCVFVIVLPFLGVFIYLIAESKGMAERNMAAAQTAKSQTDEYIRSVAAPSDPAEQIARAKELLDSGAISATEFDALKQKALAT
jgi:hypothetical protein